MLLSNSTLELARKFPGGDDDLVFIYRIPEKMTHCLLKSIVLLVVFLFTWDARARNFCADEALSAA